MKIIMNNWNKDLPIRMDMATNALIRAYTREPIEKLSIATDIL